RAIDERSARSFHELKKPWRGRPCPWIETVDKAWSSPPGRRWRVARRMRVGRFIVNIRQEATGPHPSRFASHPLPEGEGSLSRENRQSRSTDGNEVPSHRFRNAPRPLFCGRGRVARPLSFSARAVTRG